MLGMMACSHHATMQAGPCVWTGGQQKVSGVMRYGYVHMQQSSLGQFGWAATGPKSS